MVRTSQSGQSALVRIERVLVERRRNKRRSGGVVRTVARSIALEQRDGKDDENLSNDMYTGIL